MAGGHHPDINIIVHPECMLEVVEKADFVGSTASIIRQVESAEPGSKWAVGTEMHMVNRLKSENPDRMVQLLSALFLPVQHDVPHQSAGPGQCAGESG